MRNKSRIVYQIKNLLIFGNLTFNKFKYWLYKTLFFSRFIMFSIYIFRFQMFCQYFPEEWTQENNEGRTKTFRPLYVWECGWFTKGILSSSKNCCFKYENLKSMCFVFLLCIWHSSYWQSVKLLMLHFSVRCLDFYIIQHDFEINIAGFF